MSVAVAVGGSTSEKNLTLIGGAHAPIDDGFNLQGIEFGALIELGPSASIQGNYNVFWDRFDGWDGELEDLFLTLDLPAGVSLRGGQFFVPFGYENPLHLHARDFVDPPISVVRLLGEEGLIVQGGEISFHLPGPGEKTFFRMGYGQGRSHTHGGVRDYRRDLYTEALEHAGEEDHDDDDDDHEEEEEEEHSHGLAGNGGIYDVDEAYLDDGFFFARLETDICKHHGINQAGISFAGGQNGFGRTTWIIGADVFGTFAIADRPAWWRAELFYRDVDAYDNNGVAGSFNESGFYASAGYEFVQNWMLAGRAEWASGDRMAGLERRWRLSANVTHIWEIAHYADLHSRLQYSYDDLGGYGHEHTVWLQFVMNLGAGHHGHNH